MTLRIPAHQIISMHSMDINKLSQKTYLVFSEEEKIPIDPSRIIATVLEMECKTLLNEKKFIRHVVFYKDENPEEVRSQSKESQKVAEEKTLKFVKEIYPGITDETALKELALQWDAKIIETIDSANQAIEQQKRANTHKEINNPQPKTKWTYITDGFMALGALSIAFKVMELIVKKKPGQLLYGTFLTIKSALYR